MDNLTSFFKNKKNILNTLLLLTLLAGIIVGLYLTKTKQILRPKAEVAPITFLEGKCVQERNGRKVLTCLENVEIQFVSTLNATPSPSQTSTASASPSASASASPAACNPKKFDSSTWKIEKKEECIKEKQKVIYSCQGKTKTVKESCEATGSADLIESSPFSFISNVLAADDPTSGQGNENQTNEKEDGSTKDNNYACWQTCTGSEQVCEDKCGGKPPNRCQRLGASCDRQGYTSNCCSRYCDSKVCAVKTVPSPSPKRDLRVFASSKFYNGNLGGLEGADQKCQSLSDDAKLGGKWVAWLGTSDKKALDRLEDERYVNLKDEVVAFRKTDIPNRLENPVRFTDKKEDIGEKETSGLSPWAWTGVKKGGESHSKNCQNWTDNSNKEKGLQGAATLKNSQWTDWDDKSQKCNSEARIYCFEVREKFNGTVAFKYAETRADLDKARILAYDKEPIIVEHNFIDSSLGMKNIFVQFIGSDGKNIVETAQIEYVGADPFIDNIKCTTSSTNQGSIFTLKGGNFGREQGMVKGGKQDLTNVNWSGEEVMVSSQNLKCDNELEFILTRKDGAIAKGIYDPNVSLSLGAKIFCRDDRTNETEGAQIAILEEGASAPVIFDNLKISQNGLIKGLNYKFKSGRLYKVTVKTPNSVRRTAEVFKAQEGTAQLFIRKGETFLDKIRYNVLPVGDIFLPPDGDGTINTFDANLLHRLWGLVTSPEKKKGDFNVDGVINSVDWACMRYDFGAFDDPLPQAPLCPEPPVCSVGSPIVGDSQSANVCPVYVCATPSSPTPTPTPTVSLTPSPTSTSSATPVATATPTASASASPSGI